jgi:hypothetical protein
MKLPPLELTELRQRLGETMAWCAPRASVDHPRDSLRTPSLRPPNIVEIQGSGLYGKSLSERWEAAVERRRAAVTALAAERAALLRSLPGPAPAPASDLAGGRIVLYDPDANLFDDTAERASQGFCDADSVPAWDTWVCYFSEAEVPERWSPFASFLVSWVPPALVELADAAITQSPEQCIRWATELDLPFTRLLAEAGLLG